MADANADTGEAKKLLPIVPFLKIPDDGEPYLEGLKCSACGAVYLDERTVCSNCAERDKLEPYKLSDKGDLYVFSVVHRSFPGIDVPYVSAVVDLEGGGTVKGNLIHAGFDPAKIPFGMPVEVVFETAPRKDAEGNEYLTYYFQPRS